MTTRPEPVLPHFAGWQQQTTARPNAQFAFYQANRNPPQPAPASPRPNAPDRRHTPRSALTGDRP